MATKIKIKRSKNPKIKDRTLWFADKKLGTCYKVKATPNTSVQSKWLDNPAPDPDDQQCTGPYGTGSTRSSYWVKPHNALVSEVFHIGRGLAEKRENAYSWLIGSLTDDLEKLMWKIRRAANEIA